MFAFLSPWRDQITPLPLHTHTRTHARARRHTHWHGSQSLNSECISPTGSTGEMGLSSKGGHQDWAKALLVPWLQNLGSRHISVHERACVYVGGVHWEKVRNEPTSSLRRRREQRRVGCWVWVANCINTVCSKAHSQTFLCATIMYILQHIWHLTLLYKQKKKNCGLPQLKQIEKKTHFSVMTLRLQYSFLIWTVKSGLNINWKWFYWF